MHSSILKVHKSLDDTPRTLLFCLRLDERGSVNSAENDFTDGDDKGDLAKEERRMLRLRAKEMR
eukprot:scaffold10550_cov271-Chaetoceros_neogracile.AAC.69